MLAFALLLVWAALHLAGDTPLGGALRRVLVAWPARQMNRIGWRDAMPFLALLALGGGVFWLLDHEAMLIFGLAAPELLVWSAMFDLGLFADLVVTTMLLGSAARIRSLARAVRVLLPRARARRTRVRRERPAPAA
jgi:hypothetical protein